MSDAIYETNERMSGLLTMYGEAIKLAIKDYQKCKNKIRRIRKNHARLRIIKKKTRKQSQKQLYYNTTLKNYDTAKHFLFNKDWLESFIDASGLPLNICYIRKLAKRKGDKNDTNIQT